MRRMEVIHPKFKVGDKVFIVKPTEQTEMHWVDDMNREVGHVFTITSVHHGIDALNNKHNYQLYNSEWGWNENWLQPEKEWD